MRKKKKRRNALTRFFDSFPGGAIIPIMIGVVGFGFLFYVLVSVCNPN